MIVGRTAERTVLDDVIAAAAAGSGGSVVLVGEAGIGKSAVIAHGAAQAERAGLAVVELEGVRGEDDLPWAGLTQLTTRLGAALASVPEQTRSTIEHAVGHRHGGVVDRHAVFIALQSLLTEASASRPLLVIVDDLHWLDRATAQAVVFVARRLAAMPVSVVMATRDVGDLDFPTVHHLEALSPDEGRALISATASPNPVSPVVVEHLLKAAGGNPLGLRSVVGALSAAELAGEATLPNPLPNSPGLDAMLAGRVEALPEASRRVLAVAAMLGSSSHAVSTVLEIAGGSADHLHAAERAGVVSVAGGVVRFTHPLYRSSSYWTFDPPGRRNLHERCAAAEADPVRRALHLADASVGSDPELASTFEALASSAADRGAFATATALWMRGETLHDDPISQQRCALATIETAVAAGNHRLARTRLAEQPPTVESARLLSARAAVAEASGDVATAIEHWVAAAHMAQVSDTPFAVDQILTAATALIRDVDLTGVLRLLEAVPFAREEADEMRRRKLDIVEGAARVAAGFIDDAAIVAFARYVELMELDDDGLAPHLMFVAVVVAPSLALFRQHDAALEVAARLERVAIDRMLPTVAPAVATTRGMIEFRGNLSAAMAHTEHAASLAAALGHPSLGKMSLNYLTITLGQLGRTEVFDSAQALLDEGSVAHRVAARMALGVYWLTLGVPDKALEELMHIHCDPTVDAHQLVTRWQADLGEAAARCGDASLALEAAAELDDLRGDSIDPWLLGASARVRAMVATLDECGALFAESVDAFERSLHLSAIARSELLWGERLRRGRRRAEARPHLERARNLFVQVGAGRWAERAEVELVAAGASASRSDHSRDAERVLTAQELHVARLAVAGASYKDIAGRLFVSPRTVESHLSRAYRKLGVKNRAELAARAADDAALQSSSDTGG